MKLRNLTKVYVYKPIKTKVDGEYTTTWQKVNKNYYLNVQQDISELDTTSSGTINYEVYKLRSDKYFDIAKDYGISFTELSSNEVPKYYVIANPKIGNSITYVCNVYRK